MNLYLSNISFHTTESDLIALFSRFGKVASATVMSDPSTGRPQGFGFVNIADDQEATAAMSALQGREIEGRKLSISIAREKSQGGAKDKQRPTTPRTNQNSTRHFTSRIK
jgi:RNA recognition motif-containing protein